MGATPASAYNHRQRWPNFARLWDEAVKEGYMRVETALIQNANNLVDWDGEPLEVDLGPMTVADAIHVLHMHNCPVHGIGKKPGAWRRRPGGG